MIAFGTGAESGLEVSHGHGLRDRLSQVCDGPLETGVFRPRCPLAPGAAQNGPAGFISREAKRLGGVPGIRRTRPIFRPPTSPSPASQGLVMTFAGAYRSRSGAHITEHSSLTSRFDPFKEWQLVPIIAGPQMTQQVRHG